MLAFFFRVFWCFVTVFVLKPFLTFCVFFLFFLVQPLSTPLFSFFTSLFSFLPERAVNKL